MKIVKIAGIFSLCIFFSCSLSAMEDIGIEKTKLVIKNFPCSPGSQVILDNSFGDMKIQTWEKAEAKIEIVITAKSPTEKTTQMILDGITIQDMQNNGVITCKTIIENRTDEWGEGGNRNEIKKKPAGFRVTYSIFLPGNATLKIMNRFGTVLIGDYVGKLDLSVKFGDLTAGKLSDIRQLTLEFCRGFIESVSNCNMKCAFSRVQIRKLIGKITAKLEQNSGIKFHLTNELTDLYIKSDYSQVYLESDESLPATFSVSESYGSFKNQSSSVKITEAQTLAEDKKKWPGTIKYSGKFLDGKIHITVNDDYGNVIIGNTIPFDLFEKSKTKSI